VRFENRSTTLTLAPNNATHGKLAVVVLRTNIG
jgi:hypothetical protein